jgi:hypothetical protein
MRLGAFIGNSSSPLIMVEMTEERSTHTEEREKKRASERPPVRSRLWARAGFGDKTLWDLLQLLIVPLALAGIGFWFTWQQDVRQQDLEDRRAESARYVEEQRAQDAALQAYLDQMSALLIDKNLRTTEDSAVLSAARARTLTVLPGLDGHRKRSVLVFLAESQLIHRDSHIVWLVGADLSKLDMRSRANLGWNLSETVLHGTDLSDADLHRVVLRESALSNTDLSGADLSEADLTGADLTDAVLSGADLSGATVTEEQLATCRSLEGATMHNGQQYEDWLKSKGHREDGAKQRPSPTELALRDDESPL